MPQAKFKALPSSQTSLFPTDLFSKIPPNHPVRLVNSVVDSLDLSELIALYPGGGRSSYHPKMMLKVLFYSYLSNIYSCRKIAKALEENIHFMWLSGCSQVDFRTINRFRGERLKSLIHDLFSQIVLLLQEMGYVSLEVQYIDGTKIEASSNKYTFVWRKSVEKYKSKLESKIQKILKDIESSIQQDSQEENEPSIPQHIDSEQLKEKIVLINKQLKTKKKSDVKALKKLQEEHLPRLEKYEHQLNLAGDRNSYSKTDIDATFMRMKDDHMKNGQLKAAYNPQVSTENQFITHFSIHQKTTDTTTLISHLEGFKLSYGQVSKKICADAGYGSEENYEYLEEENIEAYVKYNYFHQEQKKKYQEDFFKTSNLYYNAQQDVYFCPMGQKMKKIRDGKRTSKNGYTSQISYYQAIRCEDCPLRSKCFKGKGNRMIQINKRLNQLKEKARQKLMSEEGVEHRKKRPAEVEAVFGQLKANNKFNRFTFKGLVKVNLEFALMAIGHNLRKWTKLFIFFIFKPILTFYPFFSLINRRHFQISILM